ncbi:hypothetical protein L209DRAFT_250570 [Thermothelomyces heterothallicus CBS 203.75]
MRAKWRKKRVRRLKRKRRKMRARSPQPVPDIKLVTQWVEHCDRADGRIEARHCLTPSVAMRPKKSRHHERFQQRCLLFTARHLVNLLGRKVRNGSVVS